MVSTEMTVVHIQLDSDELCDDYDLKRSFKGHKRAYAVVLLLAHNL